MSALLAYESSSDEDEEKQESVTTRPAATVIAAKASKPVPTKAKHALLDPNMARRVEALCAKYGAGKANFFDEVLGKDASNPAYMNKLCKAFMVEETASNFPPAYHPSYASKGASYKELSRSQLEAERKRAERRQVQGGGAGFGSAGGGAPKNGGGGARFQPWGTGRGGGEGDKRAAVASREGSMGDDASVVATDTKAPGTETAIERAQRVARDIAARMGGGPATKRQRRS